MSNLLPWVLGALALILSGCSGCDDDGGGTPMGDAGNDLTMDSAVPDDGKSGSGGTTPPVPDPPRFTCGTTECFVPGEDLVDLFEMLGFPSGAAPYSPCCTDGDNACGLVLSDADGTRCVPRPPSDEVCPDIDLFGVLQPGCCIEEMGVCGVNAAQIGAGCIDASGGLGPLFGVAPAMCGASDGGVDDDAGEQSGDAG